MLGEHIKILSGYAFKSKEFNENGHGIPVVRIRDVGKKKSNTFYSGEYSEEYLLDNGDFLIGMDGDFRLAKWQGGKALLNQRVCKIMSKESSLSKEYMYYMVPRELKKIEDTTSFATVKHLSVKKIKDIKIPLPPLDQQKKIADILDAADAYRKKTKALIEKYDELTQSLFLDMFGDPYVNQYNHAYVKLESLVKKKSDLVDGPFGSSVNTKVDYIENGEIPVIRTKNIGIDNRFISDDLKFMTREKYETLIRSQVLPGDIILTKVGTIGNTCIFPEDYKEAILSTTGSCRIRLDEDKINKTFFLHYLNFYRTKMLEIASAGVQAFLNMKHIKGFDILFPAADLQNQFAERVKAIEEQKAQAQASLAQAEDLFNSLLQRAFKGELTT